MIYEPGNTNDQGQPNPRATDGFTGHHPGGSPMDRRLTDRLAARGIVMGPDLPPSRPTSSHANRPALYAPPATDPQTPHACACAESPSERAERERIEQARTARRVLIAFILFLLLMPVVLVVTAISDIEIPMVAIFGLFALVLVGALMTAAGQNDGPRPQSPPEDEGRPIGCCSGPRPMRRFRQ